MSRGRGVFAQGKSLLYPLHNRRVNAPAAFPGARDVHVRLLREELSDGLDVQFRLIHGRDRKRLGGDTTSPFTDLFMTRTG